uniref:Uncharacterized protein n=1 Tax=Anguilla anguilla TaxID=7936 RepID=A0A0E9XM08_ANGAN
MLFLGETWVCCVLECCSRRCVLCSRCCCQRCVLYSRMLLPGDVCCNLECCSQRD